MIPKRLPLAHHVNQRQNDPNEHNQRTEQETSSRWRTDHPSAVLTGAIQGLLHDSKAICRSRPSPSLSSRGLGGGRGGGPAGSGRVLARRRQTVDPPSLTVSLLKSVGRAGRSAGGEAHPWGEEGRGYVRPEETSSAQRLTYGALERLSGECLWLDAEGADGRRSDDWIRWSWTR